jgi:hypothetical protein
MTEYKGYAITISSDEEEDRLYMEQEDTSCITISSDENASQMGLVAISTPEEESEGGSLYDEMLQEGILSDSSRRPIIISVDIGYRNIGIFMYDPNQCAALEWTSLDLSLTDFEPDTIIRGIENVFNPYLSRREVVRYGCHFLVEKQTRMVRMYKVALVDMALRAWLAGQSIAVSTVIPKEVKKHFGICAKGYKKRKSLAVKKAREMTDNWQIVTDEMRATFLSTKKNDDMADAFLQCMFFTSK